MFKDIAVTPASVRENDDRDALSTITHVLREHNPRVFRCNKTRRYYLLLPPKLLAKARHATHEQGDKSRAKTKLITQMVGSRSKKFAKVTCFNLGILEAVAEKIAEN